MDKGRCWSGNLFECVCYPVFAGTDLFGVLSRLMPEIQRESENVAYKLWSYCLMVTDLSSIMSDYPSKLSFFSFCQLVRFLHPLFKIVPHHCIHSQSRSFVWSPSSPTLISCFLLHIWAIQEVLGETLVQLHSSISRHPSTALERQLWRNWVESSRESEKVMWQVKNLFRRSVDCGVVKEG